MSPTARRFGPQAAERVLLHGGASLRAARSVARRALPRPAQSVVRHGCLFDQPRSQTEFVQRDLPLVRPRLAVPSRRLRRAKHIPPPPVLRRLSTAAARPEPPPATGSRGPARRRRRRREATRRTRRARPRRPPIAPRRAGTPRRRASRAASSTATPTSTRATPSSRLCAGRPKRYARPSVPSVTMPRRQSSWGRLSPLPTPSAAFPCASQAQPTGVDIIRTLTSPEVVNALTTVLLVGFAA